MASSDYLEEFEFAESLVKKAGEVISAAFNNRDKKVTEKLCHNDLVTETDQQVETLIIGSLKDKYPGSRFIGEESVSGGQKCELTDSPTWVIDPIDGTTNFVHSNPQICTILAFMVDKEVQFGIVYNPILDQLWTARRGKGAFYNGKQIKVSNCKDLSTALMIMEVGSITEERKEMVKKNYTTFIPMVRSIRTYGSAGINLALLAMGAVDIYMEMGFHIWDYAGPALIVTEAGGVAKNMDGGQIDYLARNVAATATQELLDQALPKLTKIPQERD